MPTPVEFPLDSLPLFCAHEHWGSLASFTTTGPGFRADKEAGAEPVRRTDVWDVLLDPYFGGMLATAGVSPDTAAAAAGHAGMRAWWEKEPDAACAAFVHCMQGLRLSGAFQCLRRGMLVLHNVDIAALDRHSLEAADQAIQEAYADLFSWYAAGMARMQARYVIRPVHPDFFIRRGPAAGREAALMRPILRIDPMLDWWQDACPARDRAGAWCGEDPGDAPGWRCFLARLCERTGELGNTGIKQLQAYSRTLDFDSPSDAEVRFRGDLSQEERRVFQDWIVQECCRLAHERNWPHQIHVGTHNLAQSSPLPLQSLAQRYPGMKLVLLHGWPFLAESGFLARQFPNVYLDPCWLTVLNPEFLQRALREWLGYVPANKIMLSHDATSIEMAAGSAWMTRRLLGEVLMDRLESLDLCPDSLIAGAKGLLHNHAVHVYGVGETA